jgi:hypothetical protein
MKPITSTQRKTARSTDEKGTSDDLCSSNAGRSLGRIGIRTGWRGWFRRSRRGFWRGCSRGRGHRLKWSGRYGRYRRHGRNQRRQQCWWRHDLRQRRRARHVESARHEERGHSTIQWSRRTAAVEPDRKVLIDLRSRSRAANERRGPGHHAGAVVSKKTA